MRADDRTATTLLVALDAFVRAVTRNEIARNADAGGRYSSAGPLPLGFSRRAFIERLRDGKVAGAAKTGKVWSCTREAFHYSQRRAAPTLRLVEQAAQSDEERALAMLKAAGHRLVQGAR